MPRDPERIREEYQRAELPCPECDSEDYWFNTEIDYLTVHRCLNCGYGGRGPSAEPYHDYSRRGLLELVTGGIIATTVGGMVFWEYKSSLEAFEDRCDEKYGEGEWEMVNNGTRGIHQTYNCQPINDSERGGQA